MVQLAEETINAIPTGPLSDWLAGEAATTELREAGHRPGGQSSTDWGASPFPDAEDDGDEDTTEACPLVLSLLPVIGSRGSSSPCVVVGSSGPCTSVIRTKSCRLP